MATRAGAAMRSSPGLLLISLLLGFALWVSVSDIENPTRVEVFPAAIVVEAVNVDPALAVANTIQTVDITISASEDRWQQLTSENFRAFVDLNGLTDREQLAPVQVDVQRIAGVRISAIEPASVLVNLEPLASKEVPVRTRLIGGVPLGYEVTSTVPAETTVSVFGPSSLIALVQEAVAEVSVTGLTVSLAETAQLLARGDGGGEIRGLRIEPPTTRVQITVEQSTLTRQLPLHASFSGQPAQGYRVAGVRVDPAAITVQGPIDVLQSIDALDLAAIDASGATTSITRDLQIAIPDGVEASGATTATVTVDIEVIEGTLSFAVPVTVDGLPEGATASLNSAAVVVQLAGPLPLLNAVTADAILVTVDVAGLGAGPFELTVSVQPPQGVRLLAVQPVAVSGTIQLP